MAKDLVICDTDVMIDFLDDGQVRHSRTKEVIEKDVLIDNLVISSITKMELLRGAANKRELTQIDNSLKRFGELLLNNEISKKSVDLIKKYNLSHNLAIPDSLIAATAIVANVPLFTYNVKDYKFISGLTLYKSDF